MSLSDELLGLAALHQQGQLSDAEFAQAKARLLQAPPAAPLRSSVNGLQRQRDDCWIAGVCGGLARSTGLASWAWRLGFACICLFGGAGLLVYVLLWLFVPKASA